MNLPILTPSLSTNFHNVAALFELSKLVVPKDKPNPPLVTDVPVTPLSSKLPNPALIEFLISNFHSFDERVEFAPAFSISLVPLADLIPGTYYVYKSSIFLDAEEDSIPVWSFGNAELSFLPSLDRILYFDLF